MCRGTDHGGRRCPGDNSAARLRRYHNQRARSAYAGTDLQDPRHVEPESPPDPVDEAWERHYQARENLRNLLAGDAGAEEITAATFEVGDSLRMIAEVKYGAPSDEEVSAQVKDLDEREGHILDTRRAKHVAQIKHISQEVAKYVKAEDAASPSFASDRALLRMREADPESFEQMMSLEEELRNSFNSYSTSYREHRAAVVNGFVQARAAAYRQALQDSGVAFHSADVGASLTTERTTGKARAVMSEALGNVPQTWVDASNLSVEDGGPPLRVWQSKRRAHYVSLKYKKAAMETVNGRIVDRGSKGAEWTPELGTLEFYELTKTPPDNLTVYCPQRPLEEGEWYQIPLDWDLRGRDKPDGEGWQETVINGKRAWYRHDLNPDGQGWRQEAEITIPHARDARDKKPQSVALHEFSHRTEDVLPDAARISQAFLEARTKDEAPTWLGEGYQKSEVTRRDNFSNPYVGKYYKGGGTEVLSMGMEELWYGRHGGFICEAEDAHYRAIILGSMAHTGAPRQEAS